MAASKITYFCRQARCCRPFWVVQKRVFVDRRSVPGYLGCSGRLILLTGVVPGHLGSSGKLLSSTGVVFPATWGAPGSYFCRQAWCSRPLGVLRKATFVDRRNVPGNLGSSGKLLLLTGAVFLATWGAPGSYFCRQAWCSRPLGALRKATFVDRRGVPGHLGSSGRLLLSTGVVFPATWGAPEDYFCRQAWCPRPLGTLRAATFVDRHGVPCHLGRSGKLL